MSVSLCPLVKNKKKLFRSLAFFSERFFFPNFLVRCDASTYSYIGFFHLQLYWVDVGNRLPLCEGETDFICQDGSISYELLIDKPTLLSIIDWYWYEDRFINNWLITKTANHRVNKLSIRMLSVIIDNSFLSIVFPTCNHLVFNPHCEDSDTEGLSETGWPGWLLFCCPLTLTYAWVSVQRDLVSGGVHSWRRTFGHGHHLDPGWWSYRSCLL